MFSVLLLAAVFGLQIDNASCTTNPELTTQVEAQIANLEASGVTMPANGADAFMVERVVAYADPLATSWTSAAVSNPQGQENWTLTLADSKTAATFSFTRPSVGAPLQSIFNYVTSGGDNGTLD